MYFIFLKNVLKQTWNSFNAKFQPQWKDSEKQFPSIANFSNFLELNCSNVGLQQCESLSVTKIVKKKKIEGIWGKLDSKKVSRNNNSQNIWD